MKRVGFTSTFFGGYKWRVLMHYSQSCCFYLTIKFANTDHIGGPTIRMDTSIHLNLTTG